MGHSQTIVEAAGAVLDEAGWEGLNTTAVASRAGISTATVYRHFPDKYAILQALVINLQTERAEVLAPYMTALATAPDWREPLADAIDQMWRLRTNRPGGRSSRRALQMSPELWAWDQRQDEDLAGLLGSALRRRQPALNKRRAEEVALATIRAITAVLDLACTSPQRSKRLVREAFEVAQAYLAVHLDRPQARSRRR
jgi:AcrR family transcriptional regulator